MTVTSAPPVCSTAALPGPLTARARCRRTSSVREPSSSLRGAPPVAPEVIASCGSSVEAGCSSLAETADLRSSLPDAAGLPNSLAEADALTGSPADAEGPPDSPAGTVRSEVSRRGEPPLGARLRAACRRCVLRFIRTLYVLAEIIAQRSSQRAHRNVFRVVPRSGRQSGVSAVVGSSQISVSSQHAHVVRTVIGLSPTARSVCTTGFFE